MCLTLGNILTPEQHDFWNRLKFDAQYFAHICGKEMQNKSNNKMNTLCHNYLNLAMNHLSTEDLARVVKTWLNYYHLPLDPYKLGEIFDKFHAEHSNWIYNNAKNITVIGCH
jgi:hypothetical protein